MCFVCAYIYIYTSGSHVESGKSPFYFTTSRYVKICLVTWQQGDKVPGFLPSIRVDNMRKSSRRGLELSSFPALLCLMTLHHLLFCARMKRKHISTSMKLRMRKHQAIPSLMSNEKSQSNMQAG